MAVSTAMRFSSETWRSIAIKSTIPKVSFCLRLKGMFAPRVKSNKHERPHGLPYRFLILVQINRTNRPSVKEGPRSREETRDPLVEVPAGRLRGFGGIACG